MVYKYWLLALPVALLMGFGSRTLVASPPARLTDGRIADPNLQVLEQNLGYHLFAPTWLPREGRVGTLGAMVGKKRVLQDYVCADGLPLCIVSQEHRTAARDDYHQRLFVTRSEATADVNGNKGYYVTGDSGERRLFWNETKNAIILSSTTMSDEEMIAVARKMR